MMLSGSSWRSPSVTYCFCVSRLACFALPLGGYSRPCLTPTVAAGRLAGCCKRAVYGFAGLFYLAFGGVAMSVLVGLQTVSGDAAARDWTARLLAWSWGQWLVGAVALAIIGTGVGTAVAGVRAEFADRISLPSDQKRIVAALGVVGYLARALVFTMIGLFVFFAALYANANEATGVAGTLRSIQNLQYGAVLLGITAAGLLSFGAFGLSEALFRRIPADETGRPSWHVS